MWREQVSAVLPEAEFAAPATQGQLDEVSRALSVDLPPDLIALLRESDGITGEYGAGLVWPTERIISDNLLFRADQDFAALYMPFDSLLFFADAGNGDQFAFPITSAGIRDEIYVWDHEDDSRRWYAARLEQYLAWWLGGDHPV